MNERTVDFYTKCDECIYAIWNHNIQTGCRLQRLDKFTSELINVDDKKFFKLNGFCNTCRNQEWLDITGDPTRVFKEIMTQVELVVIVNKENKQYLHDTLAEIKKQIVPFTQVLFVVEHDMRVSEIFSTLQQSGLKFSATQALKPLDRNSLIGLAISRLNGQFFMVYTCGSKINPHYVQRLNQIVNDECRKVAVVVTDEDDGMCYHTAIYKMVYKNFHTEQKLPLDSIRILASQQDSQNMILSYKDDICESNVYNLQS